MEERVSFEDLIRQNNQLKLKISELERVNRELTTARDIKSRIVEVFRSTPQMMAISNLSDGKYVEVNDCFLRTMEYKRDEIIGKSSDDIDLFSDIVQSTRFIRKLARLKKVENFEVSLKTKKGKDKLFLFSAEPLFIGNEKYLLTSYLPVNNKPGSAEDVNYSFDRLRDLFETLTNFIMVIKPDKHNRLIIEYINEESREYRSLGDTNPGNKDLMETSVINKEIIAELVTRIHITGQPQKQTLNPDGSEDEGYYFGIKTSNGEIIIIWEPAVIDRSHERDLLIQGDVFEKFANMIPNIVFEINTYGKVTFANEDGLNRFGYTKADISRGLFIKDIFGDKNFATVNRNIEELKKPGDSISNEYMAYTSTGRELPVISHTSGIFDGKGQLIGYRGILTDISEKKKIQDEIMKEKIHLETLIESAPESIVQTDINGIIERINKEFTNEFGYTPEECIGRNIDNLIIPEEISSEGMEFTRRARNNETISTETYRKTKFGEKIYVSLRIKPVILDNKPTTLFAIYRNMTNKKKDSEIKDVILNISNLALTNIGSNNIFGRIKEEIGRIWETKNFYIVLYNKENQTLTLPHFSDEKDKFDEIPIAGTLTGWLVNVNKASLLKESDIEVLEKQGKVSLIGTQCKVWLGVPLTIDREIIGAMVLQDYDDENAFSTEDLNLLNIIGNQIALVIQRNNMMENLIVERKKAEDAARLKHQFMSTMSHEIRTPLNEVIGITNLLRQSSPREDQKEYINTLNFSGNHLLTLVNDVLDFNKMESGMIVFEKVQFNINELLKDLERTYSFRTGEKGLQFIVEKDNRLPSELIGDPIRLNQIISNLLSNAIKFTEKGQIKFEIKLDEIDRKTVVLTFVISDTGIGIADDKLETVFDSYTQASDDTTRKYGGTGLGLSIVKRLIELQGSKIIVESQPGKGSSFMFSLNFGVGLTTRSAVSANSNEEDKNTRLTGKKILIAEDNKINFFVVNKFLLKWGVEVTHAENGKDALDLIENNYFDLILMDLHMPVMDGIEATEKIRKSSNQQIAGIPVIALTAAILSEHEDRIEDLHIEDYILKPFKPDELYDKIIKYSR